MAHPTCTSVITLERNVEMPEKFDSPVIRPNDASESENTHKMYRKLKILIYFNIVFSFALAACIAFVMLYLGYTLQLVSEQAVVIEKILRATKKLQESL